MQFAITNLKKIVFAMTLMLNMILHTSKVTKFRRACATTP